MRGGETFDGGLKHNKFNSLLPGAIAQEGNKKQIPDFHKCNVQDYPGQSRSEAVVIPDSVEQVSKGKKILCMRHVPRLHDPALMLPLESSPLVFSYFDYLIL